MFIDPFDRLLNTISYDLDELNLRSLVHICGHYIRGSRRDEIKHGLEVFRILKEQNVIAGTRDKIANLLTIVSEIKPKRKDVVRKVKEFIRETVDHSDILVIDLESSVDNEPVLFRDDDKTYLVSRRHSPTQCCAFNFCCCACNCYPQTVPACLCIFLVFVLIIMAIVAALAWYGDIPKVTDYLNKDPDTQRAGKYVVSLIGVIALGCLIGAIVVRNRRQRGHSMMTDADLSSTEQDASPRFRHQSSVTSSLTSIPPGRRQYRTDKRPRHQIAASSSASTISGPVYPSWMDTRRNMPGLSYSSDVVPDCADTTRNVRPADTSDDESVSGCYVVNGKPEDSVPEDEDEDERELSHAPYVDNVSDASGVFFS